MKNFIKSAIICTILATPVYAVDEPTPTPPATPAPESPSEGGSSVDGDIFVILGIVIFGTWLFSKNQPPRQSLDTLRPTVAPQDCLNKFSEIVDC